MGTNEGPGNGARSTEWTRRFAKALEESGRSRGRDFRYVEVEGGDHHEAAWAARFDRVLVFLHGKRAGGD